MPNDIISIPKTLTDFAKLKAIIMYCEGVKEDFPELAPIIDNILIIANTPSPKQ